MKFSGSRRCAKPPGRCKQCGDSVVDKDRQNKIKNFNNIILQAEKIVPLSSEYKYINNVK
jgi:hypothetical protein